MTNSTTTAEINTAGPNYLKWRGELLAELALARVPGLTLHRRPIDNGQADDQPSLLASTANGFCFFVIVRAFSSFRLHIADPQLTPEISFRLDADVVRRSQMSRSPVVLFLFDADTDHGRFLRLDRLPAPRKERFVSVRFPIESTIDAASIQTMVADFERDQKKRGA